jgi:hypothetical protein
MVSEINEASHAVFKRTAVILDKIFITKHSWGDGFRR